MASGNGGDQLDLNFSALGKPGDLDGGAGGGGDAVEAARVDLVDGGEVAEIRDLQFDSLGHYGIACNKLSTSPSASPR